MLIDFMNHTNAWIHHYKETNKVLFRVVDDKEREIYYNDNFDCLQFITALKTVGKFAHYKDDEYTMQLSGYVTTITFTNGKIELTQVHINLLIDGLTELL